MTIQYFEDTDTLYLVFRGAEVQDTKSLDESTAGPVRGEDSSPVRKPWVESPHPAFGPPSPAGGRGAGVREDSLTHGLRRGPHSAARRLTG